MFLILFLLIVASGCGEAKTTGDEITSDKIEESVEESIEEESDPNKKTGIVTGSDGKRYISKEGLNIITSPPLEGAEAVAWQHFKLRGEQKYDESLELMTGFIKEDRAEGYGRKLHEEVVGAKFLRMSDITSIAPEESEVEGAYDYRVLYTELDFSLRGEIDPENTDMRNGKNHYAVHLIQEKEESDWKIVLLGGSPPLEQ
ncbi:hypothetical protein ERL59_06410 [Chengkuizengella sp. YPA3-1-1]|uniref:DUF4829 domain-containing protein n=2 Tax=Chengkuizengella marina TaxID=2507566 RepID=A0A6N9Q1A5_9BACL|nr:hypothetical protein [Chengkuizengella marina]